MTDLHSLTSHSKKSGKIKSSYQHEHINLGCDVDYDINGTAVHGAGVVGFEGWLAGYQMTFEAGRNRVTQSNFAVGYKTDEFQLHTNVYVPNAVLSDLLCVSSSLKGRKLGYLYRVYYWAIGFVKGFAAGSGTRMSGACFYHWSSNLKEWVLFRTAYNTLASDFVK